MRLPSARAIPKACQVSLVYWVMKDRQMIMDKIGVRGTRGVLNSPALGIPLSFRNFKTATANKIR